MIDEKEIIKIFRDERSFIPNPIYMHIEKKRKGFDYYQLLILLKNIPGSIIEMVKYFKSKGHNMVAMRVYVLNETAVLTNYIETTKDSTSAEQLINDLSKMMHVREVKAVKLAETEYFDVFHFPLVFKDMRMIAISEGGFYSLRYTMLNVLGSGGAAMLYHAGVRTGSELFASLLSRIEGVEEQLKVMKDVYRALGWGIMKIKGVTLSPKEGEVIIEENIEAHEINHFKCHFTRGVLTQLFRKILGDETIKMEETNCTSVGDEYCRFVIA